MAKNGKIWRFTGEQMVYVIGTFIWHILAKLKKNPRNIFFVKSQKTRNDVKFASYINIVGQKRPKTAKIGFLPVKKLSYVIDKYYLAHFG